MTKNSYIPGFEYDIFISYARVDDALGAGNPGWVSAFVESLKTAIARELGRGEVELFIDRTGIPGFAPVSKSLDRAVEQSAIFVPIVSKGWLKSQNCLDELKKFFRTHGADAPIFPVWTADKEGFKNLPSELKSRNGYQFWKRSNGAACHRLGDPVPQANRQDHADFFRALDKLADDLATKIDDIAKSKAKEQPGPISKKTGFWALALGAAVAVAFAIHLISTPPEPLPPHPPPPPGSCRPIELNSVAENLSEGKEFRHCDDCPEMVVIKPHIDVVLTDATGKPRQWTPHAELLTTFAVSKHEITWSEFECFCAHEPDRCDPFPHDHGFGKGSMPVVDVTWEQAMAYAAWLHGLTREEYRLPSAAEWKAIALAGNSSCAAHSSQNQAPVSAVQANAETSNAWSINQLSGNVSEWVRDCAESPAGVPCNRRLACGPSWCSKKIADWCSTAESLRADVGHRHVGFRVVMHKNRPIINKPRLKPPLQI